MLNDLKFGAVTGFIISIVLGTAVGVETFAAMALGVALTAAMCCISVLVARRKAA